MIREVLPKDYKQIYQIGKTFQNNFQSIYPLEELCNNEYFKVLIYEENNKILGFLIYTNLYNTVDILDVVVDELHRHQKIATNLIDYMISSLEYGAVIYLEVAVDNTNAISLYKKFGFKTIHTRENYYNEKDAYVMERKCEND